MPFEAISPRNINRSHRTLDISITADAEGDDILRLNAMIKNIYLALWRASCSALSHWLQFQ